MKRLRQVVPLQELKIARMFSVQRELKPGQSMKSLVAKHGLRQARDIYRTNYAPDQDPRVIKNHPRYVHADWNERAAKSYLWQQKDSTEGRGKFRLYDIRPGRHMNKVEKDWVEDDHPMVKGEIPAKYIRNVWNDKTKKWQPFNRQFKKGM